MIYQHDFFYEITKDDTINCHISILVEGMEIVELEDTAELENHETVISTIEEDRECDGDNTYEESFQEKVEDENKENILEEIESESKENMKEELDSIKEKKKLQ